MQADGQRNGGALALVANDDGWRWIWAGLLLAAALIVWIGNWTNIDVMLADAAYDRRLGDFPLRHAWLAEVFSHVLLKRAMVGLGAFFVGAVLWDWFRPRTWSALRRLQMWVVALSAVLVPAAVSLLKRISGSHCPWDLDRYGGAEPYVRLFEAMPTSISAGHCMPAGHASSTMWLISLAIFLLPAKPRRAALTFATLLAAGLAVGWLQQLRGAHFLTHTLWTGWIACATVVALVWLLQRRRVAVSAENQVGLRTPEAIDDCAGAVPGGAHD